MGLDRSAELDTLTTFDYTLVLSRRNLEVDPARHAISAEKQAGGKRKLSSIFDRVLKGMQAHQQEITEIEPRGEYRSPASA
jgi:hypothetical protein